MATDSDVLPQIQKDLENLQDADLEDEDEEDHAVASTEISTLEEILAQSMAELTTLRTEREKQRQHLEQLAQEHASLQGQKEARVQRIKLEEQRKELQATLDAKLLIKQMSDEELEQQKTHQRQLRRTLKLLQDGIERILEESRNDPSTSQEDLMRAMMRQELLKGILEESFNRSQLFGEFMVEDSDESSEEGKGGGLLFHEKSKRSMSMESMMSEISSIDHSNMLAPPQTKSYKTKERVAHDITSSRNREGRSLSRSKYYTDQAEEEENTRSKSLSTHQTYENSSSSGRGRRKMKTESKRGLRRSSSLTSNSGSRPNKASLMSMLENIEGKDGQDEDCLSEDTPKTANTQGTR